MKFLVQSVCLVVGLCFAVACTDKSGGDTSAAGGSDTQGGSNAQGGAATGGTATGGSANGGSANGGSGSNAKGGSSGSTNPDAGAGGQPTPDVFPPTGMVAMFVAAGSEGRNVMSCDDGLTWKAHDVSIAVKDEANEKGLAFGHGVFMQVLGWGAVCSFLRTEDGVTWERLSLASVGLPNMSECGGITYNGDGFTMVHWGGVAYASDRNGRVWRKIGMFNNNNEHVREIAGDGPSPGVILAGGANDPSGAIKNPPHVSIDGGKTWKTTPGCSTLHAISIGQEGGGAFGAGRMVYVGYKGEVCTSTDMASWQEAQLPGISGSLQGKVNFDGELFWAADGGRLFVSTNGITWTVRTLPNNIRIHAVAKSHLGTYVGFNRTTSQFYRSTNGMTWTAATTSPPDGPDLYRILHGYGKPSADCRPR